MIKLAVDDTKIPDSPIEGIEPLLTPAQIAKWMGVSQWYVNYYGRREWDPLPLEGTARAKRATPSDIRAWMRRNKDAK